MTVHIEIAALLIDLEGELRRWNHWQSESPEAEALASTEPFCVDTLSLPQWLQFVFIPRVHALAAAQQQLPGRCDIAPMAEEYFGEAAGAEQLVAIIRQLDERLSGG
jgi:uncharacterized protein YqcC (DUF446 family)